VKTRTIHRMLRTGEVYTGRAVLVVPMARATYDAHADLWRALERDGCIKAVDYHARRHGVEVLVKLFPRDPGCDHRTARLLRNALVRLGRRGAAVRVGIYPADRRMTKWELGRTLTLGGARKTGAFSHAAAVNKAFQVLAKSRARGCLRATRG